MDRSCSCQSRAVSVSDHSTRAVITIVNRTAPVCAYDRSTSRNSSYSAVQLRYSLNCSRHNFTEFKTSSVSIQGCIGIQAFLVPHFVIASAAGKSDLSVSLPHCQASRVISQDWVDNVLTQVMEEYESLSSGRMLPTISFHLIHVNNWQPCGPQRSDQVHAFPRKTCSLVLYVSISNISPPVKVYSGCDY
jgi:hypothetical protein